jgi:hypothetical protein
MHKYHSGAAAADRLKMHVYRRENSENVPLASAAM